MASCLKAQNYCLTQYDLLSKAFCGIHQGVILQEGLLNLIDDICSGIILIKLPLHTPGANELTHWCRVTHICFVNMATIGSDKGLSPGRRKAIIWTSDGILLIGPLGTNFSEILIKIHTFSFKKMHLKLLFAKWQPFCLGLNELIISISSYRWVSTGHTRKNKYFVSIKYS